MRGILRGQEHLGFDDILSTFGVGVLIVAFVEIFQGSVDDSPALIGKIAVPYVATGLIAIGLAHAARANEETNRPFGKAWLLAVGGAVLVLALISLILALFDLGAATHAMRVAGHEGGQIFVRALYYVLWPIIQLTEGLFVVIRWLMTLVLGQPNPQLNPGAAADPTSCEQLQMSRGLAQEQAAKLCEQTMRQLPEWAKLVVRLLVAVPIVGFLLLMTAILFRRFRKRLLPANVRETTYQEGRLASDLSGMLGNLLNRLRPNIHFGRDQLDPARRLYFDMLDAAEQRGIKRAGGQTPLELAPRLIEGFHGEVPGRITDVFDDARYGAKTPSDDDVRRLRGEFDTLRSGP
jgi:hypothetical protein